MCLLDQYHKSRLIGLVLLLTWCVFVSYSLDISSIAGEVTFDVKLPPDVNTRADTDAGADDKMVLRVVRRNVTVAPLVECPYQYPEKEQVDALLSNMLNELTKVFIRAQQLVIGDENLMNSRRRFQERRFKVVAKKNTNFFENIYSNMTKNYLNFYNSTSEHVSRARHDPCTNQSVIRQLWRDILDNSIDMLRSAARSTILEHKRMMNSTEPSTARIDQFLSRQISKVKADQLHLLCYKFQLCFNDLL